MIALVHLAQVRFHVVAQIVEPKLVVGGIGDVGGIGALFLGLRLLGIDHTGGQPQLGIDLAHPFGIAFGQIIVDRDDMHALARQRVQIGGKGGDQRLAFAGFHFGNVALMQENATHQLHIKRPQTKRPFCGLAAIGKGFGQQFVQAFARRHPRLVSGGAFKDRLIAQRGKFGFQRGDTGHQRTGRLDLAVVRRAEDFPGNGSKA